MSGLELHHVWKTRGTGNRSVMALRDVSLTVDVGEVVLLEGPSGAGKSTLLAVAGGLLTADAGDVVLAGRQIKGLSHVRLRRHRSTSVGFVFQRPQLLAELTVRQNVILMARIAGMTGSDAESDADSLLSGLGLGHLAARRPVELSGGEEQRVSVARALVHRPPLLLADEPTGSLDGAAGQVVSERLCALARSRGTAVLIATHDVRLDSFATRRVRMVDGELSE